MDGISRNDAPNLLQDFNLQVMPKPKPVVQSVEEFLAADPLVSLSDFLAQGSWFETMYKYMQRHSLKRALYIQQGPSFAWPTQNR